MRERLWAVGAVLALTAAATAQEARTVSLLRSEGFHLLTGPQIASAFAKRTFTDEVYFAFRYAPDGRLEGSGMGTKVSRRWWVAGNELCQTEAVGENCFTVWKKGPEVKLLAADAVFSEGKLR